MFDLATIGINAVSLSKDNDQIGSNFEVWLVLVRAQRRECVQPFLRRLVMVKVVLFLFSLSPDLSFDAWIRNDDEVPGLQIRAVWSGASRAQTVFDDF